MCTYAACTRIICTVLCMGGGGALAEFRDGDCRAVCFVFERARAPRHFLFGKGHPMRKLYISTRAFEGHQGNGKGQRRQSPS